jgi:hypothetical protein
MVIMTATSARAQVVFTAPIKGLSAVFWSRAKGVAFAISRLGCSVLGCSSHNVLEHFG